MNPETTTRLAIIFGIVALLLSMAAMVIKYTRGHGVDWTHLVAILALLFFVMLVGRKRGIR